MKVARLPKDPGPSGWNCLLPDPKPPQSLEGDVTADWLVIGGGFAGLSAVRRLSQTCPGDRVVLLEARRIGEGPAGRNSGFMVDLPHDLNSADYGGALADDIVQTAANRHAIDCAADMAQAFGLPEEAFSRSGKINAAATDKGLRHNSDYAAHLAAMDEPFEMLDADRMAALTGTDYYQGGLFTPGAAMIQPAMYVRGVAQGLVSNRVTILENTPVTALDRNGGWTATTPAGRVRAPRVILAVNGHANSFGLFRDRLIHVFTYASMTRALTPQEVRRLGGAPVWGATPADPMGTTVRRISGTGGDRIVVRNRFTCDPGMEVDARRIGRVARDHDRAFRARFGTLGDVDMAYRWGGRLCLSRNNAPAFGEVEPGLYAACCQNGLGAARGTLAGLMAADLATGRDSPHLAVMQAKTPARLPPARLTALAANLRIRYEERSAGREF